MSQLDPNSWFTEIHQGCGSAFSLQIKSKLEEVQSPFQKVTMYDTTDFGKFMVIDDCTMVTTRENFIYHEMMSHPALFTHPAPENVVIIGGGDCGTLKEVLRHPTVKSAQQIDIDEVVTQMSLKYFPELCERNQDPRADVMFDDGIKFMAEVAESSLDVIIVDSTDPIGPGEGLFNHAFYKNCLRALRTGGILVQQSESPILHQKLMKEMRDAMLDSGFAALQTLTFPQPIYPSGYWSCTLARKGASFNGFRDEIKTLDSELAYYSADIHKGAAALPNFLKKALA
ncbi:polyamine aminopropyltransferase [Algibacillus agarilyticus]|uniref:polyamine aminopropyltransferase n=1 Tax=Algibacillus agarilyticus TaxID=2234133 RepID=UPI000DCF8626|nr:polyamine aminopropyltransferase [Algibacillus agarilyticus]